MIPPAASIIVYLNGSSSAGKSTLGAALLEAMDEPFILVGADTIFGGVDERHNRRVTPGGSDPQVEAGVGWLLDGDDRITEIRFGPLGRRMMYGLHRMVAGLADEGNNVVVDDVIFDADMMAHLAALMAGRPAYLVGVRCSLETLEAREAARGNRINGLAALLFEQPHRHAVYDIEVDTTTTRPPEAAARIRAHLHQHQPRAFNEIATRGES